jgi:type IV secretory pathway VirD2 relaxase
VKARVVPLKGRGLAAARLHLDYIEREGVEADGSKGVVFGRVSMDARADLHASLPGERHQFRFIVSPEDRDLDLRAFTRSLMRQVEADLGRDLIWGAVAHHDTDNPHVHLVVRGMDRKGREVRIDREYIARRMRWRAQEIATRELGPRSVAAIRRQRDREVDQERFTTLDRDLDRRSSGRADLTNLRAAQPEHRARLLARLRVLEELALVTRDAPGGWAFAPGWQDTLRAFGQRGDIIKRIHAALPGARSRPQIIDAKAERPPVEGVVRRKGLHDELRGDIYALVEDARGGVHYVQLDPVTATRVAEGAIVRVSVSRDTWAKAMDRALVSAAAASGGAYDPSKHLTALAERPVTIGGRIVAPREIVEANVRRLGRLARHNLAEQLPDGRWRIPIDLIAQLQARDVSHPRLRVSVDTIAPSLAAQIAERGDAWVDSARPTAPFGFGAELRRVQAQRAARRAPPLPRSGESALVSPEAQAAGTRIAHERGLQLIAPRPSLRGVLISCEDSVGRRHMAILDEATKRIAMLPPTAGAPELRGQVVEVVRRPDGTLLVRRRDLSKEG